MGKFKIYYEQLMCQLNKNKRPVIFQEVYVYEIFQNLIHDIFIHVENNGEIKYTYNDFLKLFPENVNVKKYFNKNKILNVIFCDRFENQCKLNVSKQELQIINNRFQNDRGMFVSNFQNQKNNSILLIKNNIYIGLVDDVLIHQLIHFIQWQTGMTIHNFLKKKQFDISDNDVNEISQILNIDKNVIKGMIKNVIVPDELQAYTNTIFYNLKRICYNNNKKFSRILIGYICDIFQNIKFDSFQNYYDHVKKQLKEIDFQELLNTNSFIFLLLLGYFKKEYNAFKNHIFSYFDKDKELSKNANI